MLLVWVWDDELACEDGEEIVKLGVCVAEAVIVDDAVPVEDAVWVCEAV